MPRSRSSYSSYARDGAGPYDPRYPYYNSNNYGYGYGYENENEYEYDYSAQRTRRSLCHAPGRTRRSYHGNDGFNGRRQGWGEPYYDAYVEYYSYGYGYRDEYSGGGGGRGGGGGGGGGGFVHRGGEGSGSGMEYYSDSARGGHHAYDAYRDDANDTTYNEDIRHHPRRPHHRRRSNSIFPLVASSSSSSLPTPAPSPTPNHPVRLYSTTTTTSSPTPTRAVYTPPTLHASSTPFNPLRSPPTPPNPTHPFTRDRPNPDIAQEQTEIQPQPPTQSVPSEEYLHTSLLSSTPLKTPSDARKLLILDLNGTLLIRGAHSRSRLPQNHYAQNHNYQRQPYQQQQHLGPKLRSVHPRPYMPTFRAYLFHPRTRDWLDTMVWSSAQPHSVDDMVKRCFDAEDDEGGRGGGGRGGEDAGAEKDVVAKKRGRDNLVAIWARDTLGLTDGEYHRKTQTTKDLTKPWTLLPLHSFTPSSPSQTQEAQTETQTETQTHSARTTLLLDDSPLKAHLQPYNHVCIQEYGSSMRAADLQVLASEMRASGSGLDGEGEKKKKTKTKKRKRSEISESPSNSSSPNHDTQAAQDETDPHIHEQEKYDPTLLAIIGILDAIKHESNVASWIREGGLWGPSLIPVSSLSESAAEVMTGNDASPSPATGDVLDAAATTSEAPNIHATNEDPDPTQPELGKGMWFERPPSLAYWARRGREAVSELGIRITSGIRG